ncbi:MAG: Eco57I restriction-modification methylase domain-containing protein [Chloroflexota bacterium]
MAPVIVLLKYRDSHGDYLSFTAIERTAYSQTWREGEKLGKVSMLRDINLLSPHTGHLRILDDLKLKAGVNSFDALYKQWRDVFDVQLLNKKFYQEISNWYFWAMDKVEFPADDCSDKEIRNATNLIRLLTRIIFVWFLKEKKLTPNDLFDENKLKDLLKYDDKTNSTYYKAVLQNLFFATLNAPMKKDKPNSRLFIDEAKQNGFLNEGYLQPGYYRYKRFMKDPDKLIGLLSEIPFLNGGLFECLDDLREGKAYRIDCFSNHKDNEARLTVPDELFFGAEKQVDLNKVYDTKNKKYFTRGLINILNSYKFTVAENTPIEEDIALDPELLGKVFENLLASFNPETKTTARKATGSYYTPREIVNYMVDESLIAFLETKLKEKYPKGEFEPRLRALLDYTENNQEIFNYEERSVLLDAIETVKILDPACGSGAYPMGALHKLVFALHKLDPDNKVWKAKLIGRTPREIREQTKRTLEGKSADYVRKLGLIENCIYGVDIQPIAIQISKLRFFISLIVEQTIEDSKENRGIKSLPNLEIKFVAANTLLGLEKPNENALNFTSPEVIEAEKRLFDVRRDLFYVDNYSDKKRLLKEEKKVRVTLREALAKDNYAQKTAEQIASWDPFDQNAQSDWFDPEFMFGISDGFDIVIGNPPWGLKYCIELRKKFQNSYTSNDSAGIFLELSSQLAHYVYSIIIKNAIVFSETWRPLRKMLYNDNIVSVLNAGYSFASAGIESVAICVQKKIVKNKYRIYLTEPLRQISESKVINFAGDCNKEIIINSGTLIVAELKEIENNIIQNIASKFIKFSKIIDDVKRGVDIDTICNDGIEYIRQGPQTKKFQVTTFKYINQNSLDEDKKEFYLRRKIIAKPLRGVSLAFVPDINGKLMTGSNYVNLFLKDKYNTNEFIYFLTGILNSDLMSFYVNTAIYSKNTETARHLDSSYVQRFPLPFKEEQFLDTLDVSTISEISKISKDLCSYNPQDCEYLNLITNLNAQVFKLFELYDSQIEAIYLNLGNAQKEYSYIVLDKYRIL